MIRPVLSALANAKNTQANPQPFDKNEFKLEDFFHQNKNLAQALDFLAVCSEHENDFDILQKIKP
ncbi:hypothetical protein Ctha_2021 [Chloroherpeton thalassium ATCC 35110]|uniref:Uncharacterized protein n=1 Tax=Chloroherpeton thalassium (strain ATCC 35110 / GB-78) TaxID=517418 RepID=B3QUX2_CHLT3|nr:hypothetical protein [Chloroherpeton thalassium]ACF14473.1 hypothetical protein Ctha_2021 [Chloroherpeton thalassium ATCC 35110]